MLKPGELPDKSHFLKLATWFEGSLIVIAYVIGWLFSVEPLGHIDMDLPIIIQGVMGTIPLCLIFGLANAYPTATMREIRNFLMEKLAPILQKCNWIELLYLALLAGVSEEILFRGVLQPWLERDWGYWGGLLFSNMIFALAHWITPLYGLLAGLTGVYLGLSMDYAPERQLAVPIIIHTLYDFLAFLVVAHAYRRNQSH